MGRWGGEQHVVTCERAHVSTAKAEGDCETGTLGLAVFLTLAVCAGENCERVLAHGPGQRLCMTERSAEEQPNTSL
eukprot:1330304-Rhodomonas_salina.2